MRAPQLNLSPRAKKIAKWVGYPVLAFVSFVFALQMTFPYGRLKQKIHDALAAKYDVTIGKVDRGFMPGTVIFEDVSLKSWPKKAGDTVSTIFIKKIRAHVGLLAAIGGKASIDYDVTIGGGSMSGNVGLSSSKTTVDLDIEKLSAEAVPGIADFVGLPMGGRIEGKATMDIPGGDWRQAEMKITLGCNSNCTIGDGVAKIYPKPRPGQPQLDGVTVAKLLLGSWSAEFVVTKGHGDLKKFEVKSDDGELYVDLHVQLQRSLMDSAVTQGCIKFKGSEALRKREEKFFNALNLTGAPLGPDGYHYVKLAGTLGNMRRLPQLCDMSGGGGGATDSLNPGIDTGGHIQRTPGLRTDNLDGARTPPTPTPAPTYVPPQPAAIPQPPTVMPPGSATPPNPSGPPPGPLYDAQMEPPNPGTTAPERAPGMHPSEIAPGALGGSAAGGGSGQPGTDQNMPAGGGSAAGQGTGTGSGIIVN